MQIRTRTIERLRDALLKSGQRKGLVVSSAYATLAREGLLNQQEKDTLARVDAVAETMFLMMAADDKIADTELTAVRGAVRGLTGEVLSDGIVDVMLEQYALRLREQGRQSRLREIAGAITDPNEAESAFALAAAVALADDDVDDAENQLIQELASWFRFDEERARAVLDQLADDAKA